jgi:drug/metabolite transporter (DMT)-like permease
MCVVVICLGTAVASLGEVNFSLLGIALMLGAEFTEAIRLVLTQYLLKNLKFGIVEGQVRGMGGSGAGVLVCPARKG